MKNASHSCSVCRQRRPDDFHLLIRLRMSSLASGYKVIQAANGRCNAELAARHFREFRKILTNVRRKSQTEVISVTGQIQLKEAIVQFLEQRVGYLG